jgi:hypothetical protein
MTAALHLHDEVSLALELDFLTGIAEQDEVAAFTSSGIRLPSSFVLRCDGKDLPLLRLSGAVGNDDAATFVRLPRAGGQ